MDADPDGTELYDNLGYILMTAGAAFQLRMRQVLRPFELGVTEYACLELLAKKPGLSSAELARGSFATRQLMSKVLTALEKNGLVTRDLAAPGRAVPTRLTEAGNSRRLEAGRAIRQLENAMTSRFDGEHVERLRDDLVECVAALDAYDG